MKRWNVTLMLIRFFSCSYSFYMDLPTIHKMTVFYPVCWVVRIGWLVSSCGIICFVFTLVKMMYVVLIRHNWLYELKFICYNIFYINFIFYYQHFIRVFITYVCPISCGYKIFINDLIRLLVERIIVKYSHYLKL